VWFDYRLIKGREFGLQIDAMIRQAKASSEARPRSAVPAHPSRRRFPSPPNRVTMA
jgi:hypothetical protein